MHTNIVEMNHVSLTYHETHGETLAIDDLNMTVEEGEFVAVVGPSGCGKTTMLSLMAGLMQPSKGSVSVMGKKVRAPGENIGYVLQRDHLLDWRTIEGNVLLGLEVKNMLNEETKAHALSLVKRYGLWDFLHHYPHELSGGMRQKVALIRTLAFDPELLLLDEPFSALDYQTRLSASDEIHAIIKNEHKSAILVTHDIAEAISMADRVMVLSKRPTRVKKEYLISLTCEANNPLSRRNAPEFHNYFNDIWKELDHSGKP